MLLYRRTYFLDVWLLDGDSLGRRGPSQLPKKSKHKSKMKKIPQIFRFTALNLGERIKGWEAAVLWEQPVATGEATEELSGSIIWAVMIKN